MVEIALIMFESKEKKVEAHFFSFEKENEKMNNGNSSISIHS